jgi:hypothetical protein
LNAILRHLSIRLWMTVLVGGLMLLVLMPQWQRMTAMAWMALPVLLVMAGCFVLIGWMMDRWGMALVQRQIAEAAVWERAGMVAQAEAAFERAKSAYDSFWLSPLRRRRVAAGLTMRLARFYLAQPVLGKNGRRMVKAYLHMHPEDEEVAQGWLEDTLRREGHGRDDHALAESIGAALRDRPKVQRLLMQFYLADGRADFEAVQTYRRVWRHHDALPDALVRPLARILLNENYLNDWALGVYLRGYATGDPYCLEGVAAGARFLKPNADNREDLEAARKLLSTLDDAHRQKLVRKFEPADMLSAAGVEGEPTGAPSVADATTLSRKASAFTFSGLANRAASVGLAMRRVSAAAAEGIRASGRSLRRSVPLRQAAVLALAVVTVGVLAAVGWQSLGRRQAQPVVPPEPVVEVTVPALVTDPFTIQVAAYLNPEDAQRFVDLLKQQNVDAFWTKAASANRTWYQVKVSHFATKDQARQYGEALKTRGLIDDFYVANYTP